MHKVLLTASALLLLGTAALAQPTLTAATSSPTPGLSYQLYSNSTYNAGSGGASQTWDFSTQTFGTTATPGSYVGCSAAGTSCGTFPGSNLVGNAGGGAQAYYISNGSVLSLNGFASNTASGNLIYSDAEDLLRFPFTYNSSYVDPFTVTIVNGGITFYRRGTDSVTADGWGSLKTPAGTFPNTLRIRQISTYYDSANYMGTILTISYRAVVYTWRDASHKDFLYTTSTLTSTSSQTGTNTTNSSRYSADQNVGVARTAAPLALRLFPNPARDAVSCRFRLAEAATVEVALTDLSGRLVKTLPARALPAGDQQLRLPVEELSAGVYLLQLSTGTERTVQRVMLSK